MDDNEKTPMREYYGFVWIGDEPDIRLEILAPSMEEARNLVASMYGEGHFVFLQDRRASERPRYLGCCGTQRFSERPGWGWVK